MEVKAPEVFILDAGPVQPFRTVPNGSKFMDHLGNICIKIPQVEGSNSATFHAAHDGMPPLFWFTDQAPVRPIRFS